MALISTRTAAFGLDSMAGGAGIESTDAAAGAFAGAADCWGAGVWEGVSLCGGEVEGRTESAGTAAGGSDADGRATLGAGGSTTCATACWRGRSHHQYAAEQTSIAATNSAAAVIHDEPEL